MDKETFKKLEPGDIVRHKGDGVSYMVTANFGRRVVAVCTADMTNPCEWDLVNKVVKREGKGNGH